MVFDCFVVDVVFVTFLFFLMVGFGLVGQK